MDRAALEACVGGAFFPGIEAGGLDAGNRPIIEAAYYREAFRLESCSVAPGEHHARDGAAVAGRLQRVRRQLVAGAAAERRDPAGHQRPVSWARDVGSYEDMVAKWHTLGFVVRQGAQHVEVERCDTRIDHAADAAPELHRRPAGADGHGARDSRWRSRFEVISPGARRHARVRAGRRAGASAARRRQHLGHGRADRRPTPSRPRGCGSSTGPAPRRRAIPTQTVTVREPASGQTGPSPSTPTRSRARPPPRPWCSTARAAWPRTAATGRASTCRCSRPPSIFVDVMLEGDGVGLVRYNQDAQVLQPVLQLGAGGLSDMNRSATNDLINGNSLDPGRRHLDRRRHLRGRGSSQRRGPPYDVKALVVLTDGIENRSRYIADVAAADQRERPMRSASARRRTPALPALQTISGNNGGFLLVTGAIGTDNRFLLQKYFLQILAGVSNAEVVLDPDGELVPGTRAPHPVPAHRRRRRRRRDPADARTRRPWTSALQTPNGLIIEPWRAHVASRRCATCSANGVSYYRLVLPTSSSPIASTRAAPGTRC